MTTYCCDHRQDNMAKKQKQRAETATAKSSAKKPQKMEKIITTSSEHFGSMMESSDDEGPEEVTFEDSKEEALRSMKLALETARREKELLKEKRRKRQELFQEQKKRKLLSEDVLGEIDSAPSKKQKEAEEEEVVEEEEEEEEEDQKKEKKKKKSGKTAASRNLKGNYTVTTVTERSCETFQQQTAEEFIRGRLYGPGSCRTTSNELLSLQNKKGRNKSAAVKFVKKDWAPKAKAKAEKMKKRWIHKQIPTC